MNALPPYAAADGEEIPALNEREWAGPDMREVEPVEQMLIRLRAFDDDDIGYLELWREMVAATGCSIALHYERDGEVGLGYGAPADNQTRHRSRWFHLLLADMERSETRPVTLMRQLARTGPHVDKRLADPRATTKAMRAFIRAGGRILVEPDGTIDDDFPIMRALPEVMAEQRDEALRAYFDVRKRLRSDAQIKRAAGMLGIRTDNNWLVLEAVQ